ncbi:MAG: tRNA(m5U54)methyltransferase [Thelocarpon impressellum]|nr:MAG: tRNA(m5U54)methyltransferase [Thelocarpon impressellum]
MEPITANATSEAGLANQPSKKRPFQSNGRSSKKRKIQDKLVEPGSTEEVLLADVQELFATQSISEQPDSEKSDVSPPLPEPFTEIEVSVKALSSTGDGLATHSDSSQIYVIPFTTPGDVVRAKIIKHFPLRHYTLADFSKVISPSPQRDDSLIKCPYFATCSGCQLQMLPYEDQLAHKKTIVEKAYENFSGLSSGQVPAVGPTFGSPLQYSYRTKLTPHFDGPPGSRGRRKGKKDVRWETTPPIGFMKKGTRQTIDIEDCPIATDAVRQGLKSERARVAQELEKYRRGATLLLRESTMRSHKDPPEDFTEEKTCITDPNATSTEYITSYKFSNPANAFFQNNNSILPLFTDYIRKHILPFAATNPPITHLIDAYSGSGLFTITLSSLFASSTGIDISAASIACARSNALANSCANTSFIAADASALFASITSAAAETAVILDPPRKGCDAPFLAQLLAYGPARVVYVSCNVHTQARDVGVLVRGGYKLESLVGFDFFPQTGHVEGVAVLNKAEGVGERKGEGEEEGEEK